jgi:arylsulfatase A
MDSQKITILKFSIYLIVIFLIASITITVSDATERPPNIILIMADDMGYERVGAYGGISSKTPALDTLAAQGMRFEYAYSQPLCTPSRVKIMTGLFNFRNYVGWSKLQPGEATFARYLREQGYRTLLAGKWQLNSDGGQYPWDTANGFDEVITKRGGSYEGDSYWGHPMVIYQDGKKTNIDDEQAFIPDLCAAFTRDFIKRNAQAQQPFFAYRPMYLPHSPEVCTPDQGLGPDDCSLSNQERYTAMVEYLDKEIGLLLNELDQLGIRENTLVLFTSDNGAIGRLSSELADGTIIQGGKGQTTDAGTRVPFIASWPGTIPPNRTNLNPIDFSVVLPTMLHAAIAPQLSAATIHEQLKRFDGPSILDQLRGEAGHPRGWAYGYYEPQRPQNPDIFAEFVRDERYKLYRDGKFFDIQEDPLEKDAISENDSSFETNIVRARLQGILDQIHTCEEVCKYDCREQACAVSGTPPVRVQSD